MIALDMILKILLNPKNQGSGRTKKKPSGKFPGRLFFIFLLLRLLAEAGGVKPFLILYVPLYR